LLLALLLVAAPAAQQTPRPVFRSDVNLVVVDVVVRDRTGAVVRGLTAADFEVREDDKPQQVTSFDVEEVATAPQPATPSPQLLTPGTPAPSTTSATATPVRREELAGRRLIVLLFDLSSMQPEELERATRAAADYVDHQMSDADLVAITTIDTTLKVVADFTGDREQVKTTLGQFTAVDATAFESPAAETTATDEAAAAGGDAVSADTAEYDLFNNDARLRGLRTLADMLGSIEQKKSVLYFSGGMTRSGTDNQVELRAATSGAVRANMSIYPVDTRGLQAIVPGGDASRPSARGVSAFSGRGVTQQFDRLFASQETLQTLASDTGGRARSWTPTTFSRPSRRYSATPRSTTCSATTAAMPRRMGAFAASRCVRRSLAFASSIGPATTQSATSLTRIARTASVSCRNSSRRRFLRPTCP